ncbi:MAG: TrmB family transcriptional regulator [Candidatus Doudnabacteria bacterium]|nr:TrmB family transcriptional regulator [Candidatus Doudnabacteria bacterium]
MEIPIILKTFGLNEKEIAVYLALIELGPSPVRLVSAKAKVNRGTAYDILKSLQSQGLVSFYDTKSHQNFVAEPPEKLISALEDKQEDLIFLKKQIQKDLPALQSLFEKQGGKPAVKLYEGNKGIRNILEDVLQSMAKESQKEYYIFSSAELRKNVYLAMPDFSKKRIKAGIKVKTIALGEGGQLVGMDERKWLKQSGTGKLKATYEIIYAGKVAHISLDNAENPVGVVIQNEEIYQTQKMIFEFSWGKL